MNGAPKYAAWQRPEGCGIRKEAMTADRIQDTIMPADQNMLRLIVTRWAGGLQGQLLELDIAVQGKTEEDLSVELAHALTVSYEIAVAHGEAPFASVGEPPKSIRDQWRPCNGVKQSVIPLRADVAIAVATALRWRKPVNSVVYEEALAA